MKAFVVLMGVLAMYVPMSGQAYFTAVGARLGPAIGVTLQQKIMERTTLEFLVHHRNFLDQTSAGVLIEKHMPLIMKNLNFYTGTGVQKTWYQSEEYTGDDPWGIQFVFGAELTLSRFNVSWDFKPVVTVASDDPFFQGQSAISVRYVLINGKKKGLFGGNNKKNKAKKRKAKRARARRR